MWSCVLTLQTQGRCLGMLSISITHLKKSFVLPTLSTNFIVSKFISPDLLEFSSKSVCHDVKKWFRFNEISELNNGYQISILEQNDFKKQQLLQILLFK